MGKNFTLLKSNPSAYLAEQFLSLGNQFIEEWSKVGVSIVLTRSSNLAHFRRASQKIQYFAISYLEFNLAILKEMSTYGESPKDTKLFLWRALKKLKFVPPPDFMNFIDDEDIVEVYHINEMQIFRNVCFLETTSYTIEELLCRRGFRLARRNWKSLLAMFRLILRFKINRIQEVTPWNIPEHFMEELDTAENRKFSIKLKYLIPLRSDGKNIAAILTNRCRILTDRVGV